jgi:hypothetical protein
MVSTTAIDCRILSGCRVYATTAAASSRRHVCAGALFSPSPWCSSVPIYAVPDSRSSLALRLVLRVARSNAHTTHDLPATRLPPDQVIFCDCPHHTSTVCAMRRFPRSASAQKTSRILVFKDDHMRDELAFSRTLSPKQRRIVHLVAQKLGVHYYSIGEGDERYAVVTRIDPEKVSS